MDKSAILQIQETANLQQLIAQVQQATPERPYVAIPDGVNIRSLETYMPYLERKKFTFKTTDIKSFIEYADSHEDTPSYQNPIALIDAEHPLNLRAEIIFDFDEAITGRSLHHSHKAKLELLPVAAYKEVNRIDGKRLSQKELADWIEDWGDYLSISTQSGDSMLIAVASISVRNLTIDQARSQKSSVQDFSEEMSISERIEAKNADQLPSIIEFTTIPYTSFEPKTFRFRLSIITGDERPQFGIRLLQREAMQELIADEFFEILEDQLSDGIMKFKGTE